MRTLCAIGGGSCCSQFSTLRASGTVNKLQATLVVDIRRYTCCFHCGINRFNSESTGWFHCGINRLNSACVFHLTLVTTVNTSNLFVTGECFTLHDIETQTPFRIAYRVPLVSFLIRRTTILLRMVVLSNNNNATQCSGVRCSTIKHHRQSLIL